MHCINTDSAALCCCLIRITCQITQTPNQPPAVHVATDHSYLPLSRDEYDYAHRVFLGKYWGGDRLPCRPYSDATDVGHDNIKVDL